MTREHGPCLWYTVEDAHAQCKYVLCTQVHNVLSSKAQTAGTCAGAHAHRPAHGRQPGPPRCGQQRVALHAAHGGQCRAPVPVHHNPVRPGRPNYTMSAAPVARNIHVTHLVSLYTCAWGATLTLCTTL